MHPAIIIGTVRSLIVDVAMGQIPRSTERISSRYYFLLFNVFQVVAICLTTLINEYVCMYVCMYVIEQCQGHLGSTPRCAE